MLSLFKKRAPRAAVLIALALSAARLYAQDNPTELRQDLDMLNIISTLQWLAILILIVIVYLQRRKVVHLKAEVEQAPAPANPPAPRTETAPTQSAAPAPEPTGRRGIVPPRDLPDPGLLWRYHMKGPETEKLITIGQTEGSIKTYSTEILDNHLSFYLREIEDRERDIYDLPEEIEQKYLIDIRRDGKTLMYFPGMEDYQEMGSRERINIASGEEASGLDEYWFPTLDPRQPLRFRLGDRLNQDGKFINGFFEFHLFTKDFVVKTKAGVPRREKAFFVRLYKIYPGYDTGSPNDEGLFPMIDPFSA